MTTIGIIQSEKDKFKILKYAKANDLPAPIFQYGAIDEDLRRIDKDCSHILFCSLRGLDIDAMGLVGLVGWAGKRGIRIHAIDEKFDSDSLIGQFTLKVLRSLNSNSILQS